MHACIMLRTDLEPVSLYDSRSFHACYSSSRHNVFIIDVDVFILKKLCEHNLFNVVLIVEINVYYYYY